MKFIYHKLGVKYRLSPIIVKFVKLARVGKNAGNGCYEYDDNGKKS